MTIVCIPGGYTCFSQEIKAFVTVNMDQLVFENRNYVSSLANDLMRYINNEKFTKKEWVGATIPVDITIVLSGGGQNSKYGARMLIMSKRMLDAPQGTDGGQSVNMKLYDDKWAFNYSFGANLTYNPLRFDELTSLIDFYMLMIIGADLDSYKELDGSPVYEMAKSVFQLGASAQADGYQTYSEPGAFNRYNLISEMTDPKYEGLRRLIFSYYFDGLDKMAFNRDTALAALEGVIADMADFKHDKMSSSSILMQAFFDAKADEIASLFKGWPNKKVFQNLKYLDPGDSMKYDDASEGK
jgi:hypothetical protein